MVKTLPFGNINWGFPKGFNKGLPARNRCHWSYFRHNVNKLTLVFEENLGGTTINQTMNCPICMRKSKNNFSSITRIK